VGQKKLHHFISEITLSERVTAIIGTYILQ